MRLVVSQAAEDLLQTRGGQLYVWVRKSRCCGGSHRSLASASKPPDTRVFRLAARTDAVEVFVPEHMAPLPDELHLDVSRFAREVQAYWNGCAWPT